MNKNLQEINTTSYIEEQGQTGFHLNLDGYEGPLDLLLSLAKNQKVDLKKIQLTLLADQYLDYIKAVKDKVQLDLLADYLVVASWLTFLKSKLIIPEEETSDDNYEKINELLALRLQRLESIRKYENLLFRRKKLGENFFASGTSREVKVINDNVIAVDFIDLLRSYLFIGHKKNIEFSLDNKKNYLFLENAITFIEKKLADNKDWMLIHDIVREIHRKSGNQLKSCLASIFCGSLEFVKNGKIELRQSNIFGDLSLLRRNK
ncbi:hypothetical protein CBE37_00670 [bacterium TMED277]|nr:MAG: hypothetical protein CBE37_00670 [bacterium TMED277]